MGRKKKEEPPEIEESDGEFAAVFSDLMSFLAGLFILLFTIVNSQKNSPQYFAEMSVKMGGKKLNNSRRQPPKSYWSTMFGTIYKTKRCLNMPWYWLKSNASV